MPDKITTLDIELAAQLARTPCTGRLTDSTAACLAVYPAVELQRALVDAVARDPLMHPADFESQAAYERAKRAGSRARSQALAELAQPATLRMLEDKATLARALAQCHLELGEEGDPAEGPTRLAVQPTHALVPGLDVRLQVQRLVRALAYEWVAARSPRLARFARA